MKAQSEYSVRQKGQRLASLKSKTAELERELDDVRMLLRSELDEPAPEPAYYAEPPRDAAYFSEPSTLRSRTETLINLGRYNSYRTGLSRKQKAAIGLILLSALVISLAILLSGGGASWPASVATVESQISKACQNPDVMSEPDQVNFACDQSTRQVLWVYALMTSGNDPIFNDAATGRLGLEPITPAQGGQVAWSLNLHHPYNPFNPIDSLQVAARAINSIIGGATVTGAGGLPAAVHQAGDEPGRAGRIGRGRLPEVDRGRAAGRGPKCRGAIREFEQPRRSSGASHSQAASQRKARSVTQGHPGDRFGHCGPVQGERG